LEAVRGDPKRTSALTNWRDGSPHGPARERFESSWLRSKCCGHPEAKTFRNRAHVANNWTGCDNRRTGWIHPWRAHPPFSTADMTFVAVDQGHFKPIVPTISALMPRAFCIVRWLWKTQNGILS
jgi:hypothetical protein